MNYQQHQQENFFGDFTNTTTTLNFDQQDALVQALNATTPATTPINNDWLSSDLFMKQPEFQDIFQQLLPISPPLTASPPVSEESSDIASTDAAFVALFPDILTTNVPAPRPVVAPRRLAPVAPKPIMPKTAVPIAPRPGAFTPAPMKRKLENTRMESDEAALKRQKNTDAARRSRLKKIVKMESLEKKVTELESDNSRLTTRVAVLESEKNSLIDKDKGLEDRIRVLEAQLAEAHRALTTKNA